MLKPIMAATAMLVVAGSSFVYAQQHLGQPGFGAEGEGARAEHRYRPSVEDVAAFTDARIAALKAGLELTPDQTKNWPAFEQALRDLAQLRIERMRARLAASEPGQPPMTPFDRLARRADNMAKAGSALKRVAEAGSPLYQSLTDAQKMRFRILARFLRPHHPRFAGFGPAGNRWLGRDGRRFGWDWPPSRSREESGDDARGAGERTQL